MRCVSNDKDGLRICLLCDMVHYLLVAHDNLKISDIISMIAFVNSVFPCIGSL